MPLGDGTTSDYPGSLDTAQTFTNGASPAADDSTRIDAELINDILDALLKIETELGTLPSGSYSDVKTRLDTYLPLSGSPIAQGAILYTDANGRLTHSQAFVKVGGNDGVILGGPTGGDKGPGTLNAEAVYDDNVLLTCYAIELENKKTLDMPKWDRAAGKGRTHEPARRFSERNDLDVKGYSSFWKSNGHLPAMPSPDEWSQNPLSTGDLIQRLWETVEVQAVHISKLAQRVEQLESQASSMP